MPNFVSGENSSPGCLFVVSSNGWSEGREGVLLGVFLIRTWILSDQGSMLRTHLALNTSIQAPSPNIVTWRLGLQYTNLGGT